MPLSEAIFSPERPHAPRSWPFFYGWVVMVAGIIGVLASMPGQSIGVGIFTDDLLKALHLEREQLSLAYLLGTFLGGFLMPWGGRLFDKWGARKLGLISALLFGGSLFLMAQADHFSEAFARAVPVLGSTLATMIMITLLFLIMRFLGQGMVTMVARSMVSKWFQHRRGLVMGMLGAFTGLGFSSSPVLFDYLISTFTWRGAFQLMGMVLVSAFAFICWFFYRDNPEECGLQMDGGGDYDPSTEANDELRIVHEFTREEALRTPALWLFNLGYGWLGLFITAYTFHIVDIGSDLGFSRDVIIRLFLPATCVSICTNFFCGWLSNRIRMKYFLMLMCLANMLVPSGLIMAGQMTSDDMLFQFVLPFDSAVNVITVNIATAMIIIGLGVGGGLFGMTSGVVWARYYGRAHLGAISGIMMTFMILGSALGPYVFSLYKRVAGDYLGVMFVSIIIAAGLSVAALWANNPQRKLVKQGNGTQIS